MAFPSTEPIAYYKLDESSGNAADSKNSYDLTNTNSVTYTTGKINNGADFGSPNTTKYLSRTGNPATTINGGNFTINYWGNKYTSSGTDEAAVMIECTTNGSWFRAYAMLGSARVLAGWHGGGQIADNTTSPVAGTWYMVTITNSSGTLTLFVNGVSKGSTATHYGGNLGATDSFYVGYSPGTPHAGYDDEVGVWDSVLSGTEITDLYNGGAGVTYGAGGSTIFPRKALLGVGQ